VSVNWVGVEQIGERRILIALYLALNGKSIPDIARQTGIPRQSLCDVKLHGPQSHRNKRKRVVAEKG
jgi:hypothetical protein